MGGLTDNTYFQNISSKVENSNVVNSAEKVDMAGLSQSIPTNSSSDSSTGSLPAPQKNYTAPLNFEVNAGQTASEVKFFGRGKGYNIFFTNAGFTLDFLKRSRTDTRNNSQEAITKKLDKVENPLREGLALKFGLVGASQQALPQGVGIANSKTNYLTGKEAENWKLNTLGYSKVTYPEIYPGVDVTYYGNQKHLEYDFLVGVGANPNLISFVFEGASRTEISASSDLILHIGDEQIKQHRPTVYQQADNGERIFITATYVDRGGNRFGFNIGEYDQSRPLVIDPVIAYSTYLGGTSDDEAMAIAVDANRNVFITGQTYSLDFPITSGAYQTTLQTPPDVFVSKLSADGTTLLYSTFLGGDQDDYGQAIAVDSNGNAYITGYTESSDFPVTKTAYQTTGGTGSYDAFVTKLNATGTGLIYSTYLGGDTGATPYDFGYGIALDSSNNAYVVGKTKATNFPTTTGAYQTSGGGSYDGFVSKLNTMGTDLTYSTYLGGTNSHDVAYGIALDSSNQAYLTGYTQSSNFPTTTGTYQTALKCWSKRRFCNKVSCQWNRYTLFNLSMMAVNMMV